jgi:hypothetical protein
MTFLERVEYPQELISSASAVFYQSYPRALLIEAGGPWMRRLPPTQQPSIEALDPFAQLVLFHHLPLPPIPSTIPPLVQRVVSSMSSTLYIAESADDLSLGYQIAQHFEKVLAVYRDEGQKEVQYLGLQQVKSLSREAVLRLLTDQGAHPFIQDLVGAPNNIDLHPSGTEQSDHCFYRYRSRKAFDSLPIDWKALLVFAYRVMGSGGLISLVPNQWYVGRDLESSLVLRALATISGNIFLRGNISTGLLDLIFAVPPAATIRALERSNT